jgi:plant G-box-binding factor
MASSSDEQPKPPAVTAAPQTHAEWAASLQAYYVAAGHPYAWPAQVKKNLAFTVAAPAGSVLAGFFFTLSPLMQHLMAAAAAGATYGAPVPFPVYHPGAAAAYYAHASMAAVSAPLLLRCSPHCRIGGKLGSDLWGFWSEFAAAVQGVPYPTTEASAVAASASAADGKGKGKGGGASPEKGSSGAPSAEDASRRYLPALTVAVAIRFIYFSLFPFLILVDSALNFRCLCSGDSGSDESSDTRDDDTDHKVPGNLLHARDHF